MNPALWMLGLCLIAALAMGFSSDPIVKYSGLAFFGLTLIVACGQLLYFTVKEPSRLQSEEYLLQDKSLTMMQGRDGPEIIDSVTVVPSSEIAEAEATETPAIAGPAEEAAT